MLIQGLASVGAAQLESLRDHSPGCNGNKVWDKKSVLQQGL